MKKLLTLVLTAVMGVALAGPADAAHHHVRVERAVGRFTAANDTPVLPSTPRGTATFTQRGGKPFGLDPITVHVNETGLLPNTSYVVVGYTDPVCTPDPGGTAFPSKPFTTDAQGRADVTRTINQRAINPAGRYNLAQTRSISTRAVAAQAQGLPPVTSLPVMGGLPVPVVVPIAGVPVVLPVLGNVATVTAPTSTPTVPLAVPETCDGSPTVKKAA